MYKRLENNLKVSRQIGIIAHKDYGTKRVVAAYLSICRITCIVENIIIMPDPTDWEQSRIEEPIVRDVMAIERTIMANERTF